jgi:hypothetical protein
MVVDPSKNSPDAPHNAVDDAYAESVVTAFKALLAGLSPEQQERVRSAIFQAFPQNSTPRAGQVLGTILKLVPRDRAFTIEEIKKKVEAEGIQATVKAIYNALGYLTRKQKIQRIGHGRYIIGGMSIVTSDELGGAPSREEQHDPN